VTLHPANGTILFDVAPASASVTLGGDPVPLDPNGRANESRPAGTYAVNVSAAGHTSFSPDLTVSAGSLANGHVPLQRPPASGPLWGLPSLAWAAILAVVAVVIAVGSLLRRPKSGSTSDVSEPQPYSGSQELAGEGSPEPTDDEGSNA